jgi:hypothetical protein
MADDATRQEEEVLKQELDKLNDQTAKLAEKFEALAGIDCDFGECIFDPEMDTVEKKIEEIQRRKKILVGMIEHLESCET